MRFSWRSHNILQDLSAVVVCLCVCAPNSAEFGMTHPVNGRKQMEKLLHAGEFLLLRKQLLSSSLRRGRRSALGVIEQIDRSATSSFPYPCEQRNWYVLFESSGDARSVKSRYTSNRRQLGRESGRVVSRSFPR